MKSNAYVEKKFSCVREGLTIRGLLFEPVNGKANAEGKLPVAIVSHMFMVNYKMVVKYARFQAEQGYLAVCYDFNGGGMAFARISDTDPDADGLQPGRSCFRAGGRKASRNGGKAGHVLPRPQHSR